jgi:PA14 domain
MLNRLSAKYQKEIALSLMSIFLFSGVSALKAQSSYAYAPRYNSYSTSSENKKTAKVVMPEKNSVAFSGVPKTASENNNMLGKTKTTAVQHAENVKLVLSNLLEGDKPTKKDKNLHIIQMQQKDAKKVSDIGGPGQPEMSSFKSVGSDNMVSPFTGDFSYNIPLLDVGGYPVNMFYGSGITMDQDASWVGLGWNINPGTINRNMRGLPDDFDGTDIITKRQSTRPDITWGVTAGAGLKIAGVPMTSIGVDVSGGISFNNKLGVALDAGIHPSLSISSKGADAQTSGLSYGATVGAALNVNSRNGASVTPSISFDATKHQGDFGTTASLGAGYTYSSRLGVQGMHLNAGLTKSLKNAYEDLNGDKQSVTGSIASLNSSISFLYPTVTPSIRNIYTRKNYNLSFGTGGEIFGLNVHGKIGGYYTESRIAESDKVTTHPAYGMMHYQKAENNPKALLDFNRLNDGVYTPSSPAMALPIYTYDVFSISGEGTGGSFRAYRGDMGYMRDANVLTKDDAASAGANLGFGNTIHGGVDFSYAYTPTEVGAWKANNAAAGILKFKENSGNYQAIYFKNPGEKTIPDAAYQEVIGGEDLVRFKMVNIASGTPLLTPSLIKYDASLNNIGEKQLTETNTKRTQRDKRTQVISFLTGQEAKRIGFDKKIYIYDTDSTKVIFSAGCNKAGIDSINRTDIENGGTPTNPNNAQTDSYRKSHHISEIDVLGTDGRKYIYGLPVYNTKQVDVSFAVENGSTTTGKSSYTPGVDDTTENRKGRDWFMQQEETPAYTHSFLLTQLVSPNYVDVTGNGVTEDDMGDVVKFNYSKFNEGFKWRTPTGSSSATYSEGLKTDQKDDKAHYIYGERETFLLYTIESKNMAARFYVKDDRKDCRSVLGQSGGLDAAHGMRRLDKISLFSKGDLVKYANPKPIKTVKFFQSYTLCQGTEGSVSGFGKLTLDSIWVSYNGNSKKAKSRYIFTYPSNNNPAYEYNSSDRWGNYKPASDNPTAGLNNADYPYTIQDKTKTDKNVAAWTMNKILLPSGGTINIDYESDDYAYVQNKKAASMFPILGFGLDAAPNLSSPSINRLYNGGADNDFVYIQLPAAISNGSPIDKQKELAARYFEDITQLYLKLAVTMPSGSNIPGLAGSETIPVYADIESYGLVSATVAWVKVKRVDNNATPMTQQALQFLKQQLPGKAYQGYDVSESSGGKAIVMALAGMLTSIGSLSMGDDNVLRLSGKCKETEVTKSFARLGNPYLKKLGGGLRVKRVVINDSWNKMTNQYESTYGQEYKYTTTALVNNKPTTISSGVAAWEPSVGGDENSHKEIMRFLNHNKGGPYDFGAIDMPLGEALYPAPTVGYSRVEVLSIHRDTVKNLPTRQVTEFYTTKDFPFKSSATSLADPEANVKYEPSAIKQLLHLDMQKAITLSQGFLVDMNDMNGKEKINATYSALDSVNPISYTQNYYNIERATDNTYKFNHNFPTINSAEGKVTTSLIGRDIEIMADFREHTSQTATTNISPNLDFFFLGVFPIPLTNILQPTIYEGTTYRAASVLKVVNHYGMLDSVVSIDKGSMVSTKNLVYDAETGNPLLTRTNNEHNKPIYNFSYPAHWAYSGMGAAYKNIDANYAGLNFSHGKLLNMPTDLNSIIESGDELYTIAQNTSISYVALCDANADNSNPWSTLLKSDQNRIWAVNTAKVNSITPQWVFMDKDGNPYNAVNASVRIVRSGRRNMLDQTVGSITSMSSPIDASGQLQFNNATNIIQTGAASFKDSWRVDNAFYTIDSIVTQSRWAPVRTVTVDGTNAYSLVWSKRDKCGSSWFNTDLNNGIDYFAARQFKHWNRCSPGQSESYTNGSGTRFNQKSWLQFNMPAEILAGQANILSAKLNLYTHSNELNTVSHQTVYNNPGANAWYHNNYSPNHEFPGHSNAFKLNRMIGYWPGDYSTDWQNHFNWYENDNVSDQINFAAPGETNIDYSNLSGLDNRKEATYFFKAMLRDKIDPTKNYTPAIKLSLRDFSNNYEDDATRVCFYSKGKPVINACRSAAGGCPPSYVLPHFDVKYYKCSEAYPFGYVPYVGQEVVKCTEITFQATYCRSKFTQKKSVNPYVEGMLGNWRVDSTYAYYGDRTETDPNATVDTRVGGTIKDYKKFWNFATNATSPLTKNTAAADVWVWNSTITQYNRKGYEIENKDPLGRFNSGLYGYNQQLPIAVVNNARVREVLFDGFEDYDYNTAQNCITCKPRRAFAYSVDVANALDTTEKHTGRYSLKVNAAQYVNITAPVSSVADADNGFGLRIKVDSTYTQASNTGLGLKADYYNTLNFNGNIITNNPNTSPNITLPANTAPIAGLNQNNISVRYTGKFKSDYTGAVTFRATTYTSNVRIFLLSSPTPTVPVLTTDWTVVIGNPGTTVQSNAINMQSGQFYDIVIEYQKWQGAASNIIEFKRGAGQYTNLANSFLHSPTNLVTTTNVLCSRLDSLNGRGNALTDTFSLIKTKKMILSAWVKEGGNDCKCSTYVKNGISINFPVTGIAAVSLKPEGSIIEGWQRYEGVFDVPANATTVTVTLSNSTTNAPVYFDDIRIHPFNANMKSFVYHSSNLRLMSELDENNYASFYEYDDDGTLTRVKKETQLGIKTITETRSAMQKQ